MGIYTLYYSLLWFLEEHEKYYETQKNNVRQEITDAGLMKIIENDLTFRNFVICNCCAFKEAYRAPEVKKKTTNFVILKKQ